MELHEFVRETLTQIINGVVEAQNSQIVRDNNAEIIPYSVSSSNSKITNRDIEFDVVVSAQSENSTKAGLGVFVGPIGAGTQAKINSNDSMQNRVKFSIPIVFPTQKGNKNE